VTEYVLQNKIFLIRPKITGVTGISACGKSTLARRILAKIATKEILLNIDHVNLDDFFYPLSKFPLLENIASLVPKEFNSDKPWVNMDRADAINWELAISEIQKIISRGADNIIIEGAHLLCESRISDMCDEIFYIDCPFHVAKQRRLDRRPNRPPELLPAWHAYWDTYLIPFSEAVKSKAEKSGFVKFVSHVDPDLGNIVLRTFAAD